MIIKRKRSVYRRKSVLLLMCLLLLVSLSSTFKVNSLGVWYVLVADSAPGCCCCCFFFTVKEKLWNWAHSTVWHHIFKFNAEPSVLLHQDLNYCFNWDYVCSKAILCVYVGVLHVCVMITSSQHRHTDVSPLKCQSRSIEPPQPSSRTKTNISHRPDVPSTIQHIFFFSDQKLAALPSSSSLTAPAVNSSIYKRSSI